jgi:hypothetical protein
MLSLQDGTAHQRAATRVNFSMPSRADFVPHDMTRSDRLKTGRTEDSVRAKASKEGIALKPANQRPYNRTR